MSSMGGVTLGQSGMLHIPAPVQNTQGQKTADKDAKLDVDATPPAEGVSVTISGAALKAAGAQKADNSDIEDSGLPDNIQKLLKMIRDVKKQIAEKQQQLQQVLTNSSLSPEQAKAQASALQGEISSLTASLITLNASLAKAMKDMSSDDALKAASLAAK
nr:hypothetical protein [Pseudomonas lundensis]